MNLTHELRSAKARVSSQDESDGVLGRLFQIVGTTNKVCVECGAGGSSDGSNTGHLIRSCGWQGVLIDGLDTAENRKRGVHNHWLTRDNFVPLVQAHGCPAEPDFVSLDLDGNDYHVLERILPELRPRVVEVEFNPIFAEGVDLRIRYNPDHVWGGDTYYGFSWAAGTRLFEANGYTVVYSLAINMFAVRNDLLSGMTVESNLWPGKLFDHKPHPEGKLWEHPRTL